MRREPDSRNISVSGAEFIASTIASFGIDHVFFVDAILRETLVELEKRGIRRILAHSEQAAAYMADGYARASGKPGVCMAQSVGAANLASGLQDAFLNRTPVIAMTGRKNPIYQHRNAYQELPHAPMYAAVTKFHADVATIEQAPYLVPQAFREAMSGTRRPTHLDFDGYRGADIDTAHLTLPGDVYRQFLDHRAPAAPEAARADVAEATAILSAAQRPMLVVGVGASEPGIGGAVRAFADTLAVPVATSVGGRGLIETSHPKHFGVLGTYSAPYANEALYEADLVIYAGCHVGDQITCDWTNPRIGTRILQIDVDSAELGRNYPNTFGLVGSPARVLQQLAVAGGTVPDRSAWLRRCADALRSWRDNAAPVTTSLATPIRAERLAAEVSDCLPETAMVVADTGFSAIWTAQFTEFRFPGQTYLRAAGTLGWAFPASIGAKLAAPGRPVICFTGDGALCYHLAEIETMKRQNVPVVVVVNNNSALGQGLRSVKKLYAGREGQLKDLALFGQVDFSRAAEAFGVRGARVNEPQDIVPTIKSAVAAGEPFLIDVVTDPDCNPEPPWLPPP
jgi:acetolactate synthase-1/2/3 large subunit